jgi:hypothetical protein
MSAAWFIAPIVIGVIGALLARRSRLSNWSASSIDDPGSASRVSLTGGPWRGQTVVIEDGLPSELATLNHPTNGLFGRGVRNGCYVVVERDEASRVAKAEWESFPADRPR